MFNKWWLSLIGLLVCSVVLTMLILCFYFYITQIHSNFLAYIIFIVFLIVTTIFWLVGWYFLIYDLKKLKHSKKLKINEYESFERTMLNILVTDEKDDNHLYDYKEFI